MTWLAIAAILAAGGGGLVYALRRFVFRAIEDAGATREKLRQAERDLQTARDQAKDAAKAEETRHEIDRSSFDDAVDRL